MKIILLHAALPFGPRSAVLCVLDILEQLEVHGNKNVLSDVGIGARCAESVLWAAESIYS